MSLMAANSATHVMILSHDPVDLIVLAVPVIAHLWCRELGTQRCSALVRGIHLEYVEHRRSGKLIAAAQEERVEAVHQLRASSHSHLVCVAVEYIKG